MWLFILGTAFTIAMASFLIKEKYPIFTIIKFFAIGISVSFLMGFIFPNMIDGITKDIEESYYFPWCPKDNLEHYEQSVAWISSSKELVNEFESHGWQNITVREVHDGGFFGGQTQVVSGDCKL